MASDIALGSHGWTGGGRDERAKGGASRRFLARCPFCSARLEVDADRCASCAIDLSQKCGGCGRPTPPQGRFCVHCGEDLRTGAANGLTPELRQLTVVFYDLVGSTSLVTSLGLEAATTIIAEFHREVTAVMSRFGGFVAHYGGDGALVMFGYPCAHEDDAQSAIRASWEAIQVVAAMRLDDGRRLAVRIGGANGLAVVGDMVGGGGPRALDVSAEAANLAARLQAIAEPNALLISDDLRRMVGGRLDARDLGRRAIKGWTRPVKVWQVLGIASRSDRFEARTAERHTPMVGRTAETAMLLDLWQAARGGRGSALLLSGEPGIGKSRLVAHVAELVGGEAAVCARCHCVPQQQLAPLQPFIERIEDAAGFAADDTAAVRRDKLRAALGPADEQDLALIAALLGTPFERRLRHLDELQPRQRRARTLQALLRVVARIARRGPVLLIVEDAHWCDPTSRELLELIAAQIADVPMLLVVTGRPGIPTAWASRHVSLEPLGTIDSARLVETVAAGAGLPEDLVGAIVARSDGVPLFLEELTRTVLDDAERGSADGARRAYDNQAPVPSSLRALLTSRLDRLGDAREIASIAAVIGREFSLGMLSRIASMRLRTLRDGLSRLMESGLVLSRRGGAGEYRFKHALVHDAAYGLMTRSRRAVFHERIAAALETIPEAQPQRIAHHWIEAGVVRKAVEWSVRAGTESLRRLSAEETIAQLRRGLALLEKCPDDEWKCRSELSLCLLIGKAQLAARTHADQGATATFARARALCERLSDPPELLAVLFAQCMQSFTRAEHATALQRAEEVLALGESRDDRAWTAAGCFTVGMTSLPIGNLAAARSHFERGIALYDAARRDAYARPFIGDPLVIMRTYLSAYALTALGRIDEARRMSDQAVADARRIDQMWSLTSALWNRGFMTYTLGSHEESLHLWAEAHSLARDFGIVHCEALSTMGRGWCVAALGEAREGLALARLGLGTLRRTGYRLLVPTYVLHEAVILGRLGETAEALARVAAAMRLARRTGALWDLAEMHRVRGELLWDSGEQSAALRAFERALRAARGNNALLFEQRALRSLSERAPGRTALQCTNSKRRSAGTDACTRAPT